MSVWNCPFHENLFVLAHLTELCDEENRVVVDSYSLYAEVEGLDREDESLSAVGCLRLRLYEGAQCSRGLLASRS